MSEIKETNSAKFRPYISTGENTAGVTVRAIILGPILSLAAFMALVVVFYTVARKYEGNGNQGNW